MSALRIAREGFTISNASGEPMHGDLRYAAGVHDAPTIVICHSFMAFKDWGFFPYIGEKLATAGFVSVAFNFSYNGVTNHENRITDFVKFEQNTFHREFSDLSCVIDAISREEIGPSKIDSKRIALLGHSRGGGIAILHAALDRRVRALVTWSAISTFDRWTDHQKERWRSLGYLPLAKDTTTSPLRLGLNLLKDYEQHAEELSIIGAARRVRVPWLIVHGDADLTVQRKEAESLYQAADHETAELMLVDSVGHLYNASSQAEDAYRTLDFILERTTDWLHRHLS